MLILNKKARIAVTVLVAAAIAVLAFVAGFITERYSADRTVSSYEWALKTITDNYYFGEPDGKYTETSLSAIADKYLDRYSEYYTKEEYEEVVKSNSGSKSGIGISYSFVKDRGIFLSRVVGNSPAHLSGLRAGEWIKSGKTEGGSAVTFTSLNGFSDFVSSVKDGVKIELTAEDGKTYSVAKCEYTASYTSLSTSATGWTFHDAAEGGLALYEETSLRLDYLPEGCAYLKLVKL